MTTTTSSSRSGQTMALYRSAVKRQLPFAVVFGIVYCLLLPLVYFTGMRSQSVMLASGAPTAAEIAKYAREGLFRCGIYLAGVHAGVVTAALILLAFVMALTQNAYLHSKRRTDFYHSLPIGRPGLLRVNFLASMTTMFVPFLAVYMLTLAAELIRFGRYMQSPVNFVLYTATDLLCCVLAAAVVYLFVTVIAVNTGTVFDTFALSGVIGILPLVVWISGQAVWSAMIYGSDPRVNQMALLSPFTFPFQRFLNLSYTRRASTDYSAFLQTTGQMLIWLVLGIGLYLLAVFCYNRRRSEIAEQAQPVGALQTLTKCFGAFCGGMLFFAIFLQWGAAAWVPATLAGAVLVGLIAEVILSRGFRSVRQNAKWLLLTGAVCVCMVVVIRLDLTGYVENVPEPQQVESIEISYRGRFETLSQNRIRIPVNSAGEGLFSATTLTDPASIELFTRVHTQAVQDQPPLEYTSYDYEDTAVTHPYLGLWVTYRLQNGKTLSRHYGRIASQALLTLSGLEDKDDFITTSHAVFDIGGEGPLYLRNIQLYDPIGRQRAVPILTEDEGGRLLAAIRQDMLEETLEEILDPGAPAVGSLEIWYNYYPNGERPDVGSVYDGGIYGGSACSVIVGQGYRNTLAVLTELGLIEHFAVNEEIDSIVLEPVMLYYSTIGTVYTLAPSDSYVHTSVHEEYSIKCENAGEIAAVRAAARNQLYSRAANQDTTDLVAVGYYQGAARLGAQLVRRSALPANLQAQLEERYRAAVALQERDVYEALYEEIDVELLTEEVSGVVAEEAAATIGVF